MKLPAYISNAYLSLFLFGQVFLNNGCTLNNDIDIDVPEQVPAIIVQGYLTPDNTVGISVARNNLLHDEMILQSVWNAEAFITDRSDTLELANIFTFNKGRNMIINYLNNSLPGVLSGDTLYLTIVTEQGDTLTGKTETTTPISIVNAEIDNNTLNITKDIPGGTFTGYLRVDVTSYKGDSVYTTDSDFLDLSLSDSDLFHLPLSAGATGSDSLLVKTFHITEAYYNYAVSTFNATDAYSDPFLTPDGIDSNVTNGIGIFTYYTSDSSMLRLH